MSTETKKINAVIVDDETRSREVLKDLLLQFCPNVTIQGEAGNIEEAYNLIRRTNAVNLVFLDIEMPNGNGFQLLEKFENLPFQVIFVTAFNQYALKAIQCSALDYLLKPVSVEDLSKAVERAEHNLKVDLALEDYQKLLRNIRAWQEGNKKIALHHKEGMDFVELKEIVRCEADGNYSWVYCKQHNRLLVTKSLREFEDLLSDYHFFRTHRSHLINLNYLKAIRKTDGGHVVLTDGSKVAITKNRMRMLTEKLEQL
jgi:two-component system LytT family response regulator